jgi:hypothetical protein
MTDYDETLLAVHADLARLQFETQKAQLRAQVATATETVPEVVQKSIDSLEATEYKPVETELWGFLYMKVLTGIHYGNDLYGIEGRGGGLAAGYAHSWGAAWLNYPLETLDGWDFRFQANVGFTTTNVNWWGMHGEYIGSFVGAGVEIGLGVFGGSGTIGRL